MTDKLWKRIGDGLYQRDRSFYHRLQIDGRRTWAKLESKTLRSAKLEISELIHSQNKSDKCSVNNVLDFYLDHDCPKRNEQPRTGRQLTMEQGRVENLKKFFRKHSASSISHGTLRSYREWRGNTRACELDIITLACAYRWAYRNPEQTGLTTNPMPMDRPKFAPVQKHCRDKQPANASQLHAIARDMLSDPRSGCMGWMVLFLALTGLRRDKARMMRLDARDHEAGHHDGECIWVGTSQTHKGVFPFIKLHDALRQWWDAFMDWRLVNGISSPWYFPSPRNPVNPVSRDGLGQGMRRSCKHLGFPSCSPHGLRSYYVNVLRSQGIMDAEIALRIGHRSGGKLIVDVYGEITPHPITFMPEGEPAWSVTTGVTTCDHILERKQNVK